MALKRKYKSVISLFEANLFSNGKRTGAENTILEVLKKSKFKFSALHGMHSMVSTAFQNVNPSVKVSSKRVGGSVYRIPLFLDLVKRDPLCAKWLVRSSCDRKMGDRKTQLFREFCASLVNEGGAVQKKRSLQNIAVANRSYIKYM